MARKPTDPSDNSGYGEVTPDDKCEAQKPEPRKPRNPDEGGMARDPKPETSVD